MVLFRGSMRGFIWGGAWLNSGGMHGFIQQGACMVLFSGGGMCGFIRGGVRGFIQRGVHGFIQRGACMVLFSGGHAWFYSGGACVVFSVFPDTMTYGQ